MVRNCAPENLEVPGSRSRAPRNDAANKKPAVIATAGLFGAQLLPAPVLDAIPSRFID